LIAGDFVRLRKDRTAERAATEYVQVFANVYLKSRLSALHSFDARQESTTEKLDDAAGRAESRIGG
jgi:hypothetical protein